MGYISTRMHGLADYGVGVLLIIAPYLFGFATGGIEQWLPMLLGFAVIVYSMLTRYEWGLLPIIGMPAHIALDIGGGLLLAVSPWLFGFAEIVWIPHLVVGLIEIGTAAMTSRRPELIQAPYVAGNESMATGMTVGIAAVLAIIVGSAIIYTDGTGPTIGENVVGLDDPSPVPDEDTAANDGLTTQPAD